VVWLVVASCTMMALTFFATLTASAAKPDTTRPPGNNGTVKIDGITFDDHPNNEPHVGCVFQIDLYGYDEGDLQATYEFRLWSPTGSGVLREGSVAIGHDPAGGGTDLDASVTIDLTQALANSGATPHPIQGYHVRLTIHAEGSIGADVKHKMFWVRCAPLVPGPSVSPTVSPSPSTSVSPSGSPSASPSGSPSQSPSPSESVSPTDSPSPSESVSPTDSPSPTDSDSPTPSTSVLVKNPTGTPPGGGTALTGSSDPAGLLLLVTALLLLGSASFRLASSRSHR